MNTDTELQSPVASEVAEASEGWLSSRLASADPGTRLSWIAGIGSFTWVLSLAHGLFVLSLDLPAHGMEARLVPAAAVILAASVVTFLAVRKSWLPDRWIAAWGLGYGYLTVLIPEVLFIGSPLPDLPVRAAPFSIIAMVFLPLFLQWSARTTVIWSLLVVPVPSLAVLCAPLFGAPAPSWEEPLLWASGPLIVAPMTVLAAMHFDGVRAAAERAQALARDLGSYRLDYRLGKGGMGEVWRGEHRLLARPVALKLIRPDLEVGSARLAEMRRRFFDEARATSELESAHTVSLYDFGSAPDGTLFYVMELIDGIDLAQAVASGGSMHPARVVHILRQVLLSLGEAHERGLVHRDVKPANIMLCRSARQWDHVKVLDFGIARRVEASASMSTSHDTEQGVVIGTPAFMAPEVVQGAPAGPRADLYAVGCVAWYLLCGREVFEAETPIAMAVEHCTTVPDSTTRWAAVPEELDALVMRMLEKAPEERPASADEVLAVLDALEMESWTQEEARLWWAHQAGRASAVPDGGGASSETWVFLAEVEGDPRS